MHSTQLVNSSVFIQALKRAVILGCGSPTIPVILAGGPGRGDQKLTCWRGHKQQCVSSAPSGAVTEINTAL